jgi:Na+/phosphate symporter
MQTGGTLNLIEITGLLVGGLALFPFGLDLMTGGLKAIAGARLQSLLGTMTANRFRGAAEFLDDHHGAAGRLRIGGADDASAVDPGDHGRQYLLFNVLGVLFFAFAIPQFADFIRQISPSAPELAGAARLAAETPRQPANAHTVFSVFSTAVPIWFTGPIGKLAERLAPPARKGWQDPGMPRYLDETLDTMPALAISRVQLELVALGRQVQDLVQRSATLVVEGSSQELVKLTDQDKTADSLSTAILTYIGHLSDAVHTDDEGHQLVDLARIAI